MKIVLARSAGFCFGVRSAVDRISRALGQHSRIQIDGDLIHNPQTISILSKRGLSKVNTVDDTSPAAIRTHGTTSEKLRQTHALSKTVFNLTCPRVSRIQGIIRKYSREGYYTLLVGDEGHPEVISLKSYAESGISVIRSELELPARKHEKMILISQTTIDRALFETLRSAVVRSYPETVVFDTICDSTGNKQSELRAALDSGADTVVVIGGKHSANTRSLAAIARESGAKTLHIESAEECTEDDFTGSSFVFITAGASTPDWAIRDTVDRISELNLGNFSRGLRIAANLADAASCLYIFSAAAAGLAVYALSHSCIAGAAAAVSYTAFSLCAEYLLLPFTFFSSRRRHTFYTHPVMFLRNGSFAGKGPAPLPIGTGFTILSIRIASIIIVPAAYLTAVPHFGFHHTAGAAVLLGFSAVPFLAREILDAHTDRITGKYSAVPEGNRGLAVMLAAAVAGAAAWGASVYAEPGFNIPLLLVCIAPFADCAAVLLRAAGVRTAQPIPECIRLGLAAASVFLLR
jgi:(E)-4-hydroxy-3-methyl-but-2-enyl pyrophosphate reductase